MLCTMLPQRPLSTRLVLMGDFNLWRGHPIPPWLTSVRKLWLLAIYKDKNHVMMAGLMKTGLVDVNLKKGTLWKLLPISVIMMYPVCTHSVLIWRALNWICVQRSRSWISITSVWTSVPLATIAGMGAAVFSFPSTCRQFTMLSLLLQNKFYQLILWMHCIHSLLLGNHFYSWGSLFVGNQNFHSLCGLIFVGRKCKIMLLNITQRLVYRIRSWECKFLGRVYLRKPQMLVHHKQWWFHIISGILSWSNHANEKTKAQT